MIDNHGRQRRCWIEKTAVHHQDANLHCKKGLKKGTEFGPGAWGSANRMRGSQHASCSALLIFRAYRILVNLEIPTMGILQEYSLKKVRINRHCNITLLDFLTSNHLCLLLSSFFVSRQEWGLRHLSKRLDIISLWLHLPDLDECWLSSRLSQRSQKWRALPPPLL